MLPDFIKLKKENSKILNMYLDNRVVFYSTGFEGAGKYFIHEGSKSEITRKTDAPEEIEMSRITTGVEIDKSIVKSGDVNNIMLKVDEMAKKIAYEQEKALFQQLIKLTEKHGQTTKMTESSKVESSVHEMMYNSIEKMNIDFDKEGKPILPTVFCSKQMFEKIKQANEDKSAETLEAKRKYEELLEQKKKDYYEREDRRKLVD